MKKGSYCIYHADTDTHLHTTNNEKLGKTPWKSRTINYTLVAVWLKSIILLYTCQLCVCVCVLEDFVKQFTVIFSCFVNSLYIDILCGTHTQKCGCKTKSILNVKYTKQHSIVSGCKKVFSACSLLFPSHKSLWTNLLFRPQCCCFILNNYCCNKRTRVRCSNITN